MSITVIKLGGSLLGSDELPEWLEEIRSFANHQNVIIVPGGGEYANCIREQQARLNYSDRVAHRQALLSMCQTGYLLKEYCDDLQVVEASGKLSPFLDQGLPLLWLPFELLENSDHEKQNWDHTSDSLSLWLANQISADNLVFAKHCQYTPDFKLIDYIKNGVLDKGIQSLIEYNKCKIYIFPVQEFTNFSKPDEWQHYLINTTH